ncbi:MAG: TonB-dependent receptor, partial [Bryobacteraceae bacterium]
LQARIEKRFSNSFTFQASYTYSKFMEAISYLNAADPMPEEVISDQDFPHRLAASGIWELPLGRGKQWLNNRGLAERILGGWQVQGVYQAQSGQALGFGNALVPGNLDAAALPGGERSVERWFDTSLFERNASQQLAFNVRTLSSRFSHIRRAGINNWDISVIKNMHLKERVRLQFRGEFLNAFNHAMFANPNTSPVSTAFGTVTSENGYPRRIQLGLKMVF